MRQEQLIRDEHDYNIEFTDVIKVEQGEHYTSISRFFRLGEKADMDLILLTPSELKKMAEALNSLLAEKEG